MYQILVEEVVLFSFEQNWIVLENSQSGYSLELLLQKTFMMRLY